MNHFKYYKWNARKTDWSNILCFGTRHIQLIFKRTDQSDEGVGVAVNEGQPLGMRPAFYKLQDESKH